MATWDIRGEYMESCNCDYLCPCIYTNPKAEATNDHCYAFMAFRINNGTYGDIQLDGLKFALIIRSGKVMALGNVAFELQPVDRLVQALLKRHDVLSTCRVAVLACLATPNASTDDGILRPYPSVVPICKCWCYVSHCDTFGESVMWDVLLEKCLPRHNTD